jgi:hypothetical protein
MRRLIATVTLAAAAVTPALIGTAAIASPLAAHRSQVTDDRGKHREPGDDRGKHREPGDDRGRHHEPRDDHGHHAEPGDDSRTV